MMERMIEIIKKIIFPPTSVVILSIPVTVGMMIYAFLYIDVQEFMVYGCYSFSFYTLVIECVRIPELWKCLRKFQNKNKYVIRYKSDVHLKVKLSLLGSVVINSFYALLQLFLGYYYQSVWFYALGGYYVLLVIMRGVLLKECIRSAPGQNLYVEWKRYEFCGKLLLMMNLVLVVIVTYIVWQNRGFSYHYIHTLTMATYTFAAFTMAIVNVVKYRDYKSPLLSAAKTIGLVSALVSMLSLETAMLSAFGEKNQIEFRQIMTGCTGIVVCIFVLCIAVYMILSAKKGIRKLEERSKI